MRATALAVLTTLIACTSSSSPSSSTTLTEGGALPMCTRAAGIADADVAVSGECSAARAFVMCTFSNGSGEVCLSDDPTTCPGSNAVGASDPSCTNACTATEYAVACGGPGPVQGPQPPTACRSISVTPAGTEFFCCACL